MARAPVVTREDLSAEDQHYFDELGKQRGVVTGPYSMLLHVPRLAARVGATGDFVRYEGELPETLKEAIILSTAREIGSQYVFAGHAGLAREAGLSEETIHAIADGTAPEGLSGDEQMGVRYTQELVRGHKVAETTFNAAKERLGVRGVVELTALIGHYLMVGHVLTAFEVELPQGTAPLLPL